MKERHKRSEKRARDYARFHVRVTRDEYTQIMQNSRNTSKSPAELMRLLAQGYEPVSTIDAQHIVKLLHLRGDLGRLGGLFKAWLFGDPRKPGPSARQIRVSLTEMDSLREQIKEVVQLLRAGAAG